MSRLATGLTPAAATALPAPTARDDAQPSPPGLMGQALATGATPVTLAAGQHALLALATADKGGTTRVAATPAQGELAFRLADRRFDKYKHQPRYGLKAARRAQVGDTASFWVYVRDGESGPVEKQVRATCARAGTHSLIWVDNQQGAASLGERVESFGKAFDEHVWPTDARVFGAPVPGDRDARISMLVTPEVGDHGKEGTIGYFTARDLFSPADAPQDPELAHSNNRLILYLSGTVMATGTEQDALGTMAHELQHLTSATYKLNGPHAGGKQEDVWLNEAMSMYAMEANGYGITSGAEVVTNHVASYLQTPDEFPLVDWSQSRTGSNYGGGYLFSLYLAERLGEDVMTKLIDAPEIGVANIDARMAAQNGSMRSLFRDWVAALALDGSTRTADPIHQFKAIDLHGTYGGRQLTGPKAPDVTLPGTVAAKLPAWTARFATLTSATGGSWQVDLGAAPIGWLWP